MKMNHRSLSSVAFLILLSFAAFAQDPAKPPTGPASPEAQQFSRKAARLSGTVSDDGRFFVADLDDAVWTVTNPEALRSYSGRRVTLQVQTRPATDELRVLCVKPREVELSPARLGDAAFRR